MGREEDPGRDVEEPHSPPREIHLPLSIRGRLILLQLFFLLLVVMATNTVIQYAVITVNESNITVESGQLPEPEVGPRFILEDDLNDLYSEDSNWFFWEQGAGSVNSSGGFAFLNLDKNNSALSVSGIYDILGDWKAKWFHVSLEIRLRCGDDNSIHGGTGAGHRGWGFVDENIYPDWPHNFLLFNSHSPESDPSLTGFYAMVGINGSIVQMKDISYIDMREWHNYTILWEPGNATFLVDGETVLSIRDLPDVPMATGVITQTRSDTLLTNGKIKRKEELVIGHDQYIQVDYVQIFMSRQNNNEYLEEANQTLATASSNLHSAELMGIDTGPLRENRDQATRALSQDGYIPAALHTRMVSLAETLPQYLDELSDQFQKAEKKIEDLILEDRDIRPIKAWLDIAIKALWECDYPLAINYLRKITEDGG